MSHLKQRSNGVNLDLSLLLQIKCNRLQSIEALVFDNCKRLLFRGCPSPSSHAAIAPAPD